LVSRMNSRDQENGKARDGNRKVYCGAYRFTSAAVRLLAATEGLEEIEFADVTHREEDGEIAHTDLKIVLRVGNDLDIEGTITAIVDRLWNSCCGPHRHICDCDSEMDPHPSTLLEVPPVGGC
jgi:hypothetical protein